MNCSQRRWRMTQWDGGGVDGGEGIATVTATLPIWSQPPVPSPTTIGTTRCCLRRPARLNADIANCRESRRRPAALLRHLRTTTQFKYFSTSCATRQTMHARFYSKNSCPLSLATPLWFCATGNGFGHRWGRNTELCVAIG